MKAFLALCVGVLLPLSASAQSFRPAMVRAAVSADSRHNSGAHVAVGYRDHHGYRGDHHSRTHVSVGFGYSPYWRGRHAYPASYGYPYWAYSPWYGYRSYGYYDPVYVGYTSTYTPYRSSRASTGMLLGGIAGAIIGNNSGSWHHNGWHGAAIGAGAGLLLGAIADDVAAERAARSAPAVVYASPDNEPAIYATPTDDSPAAKAARTAPQNVTIINNYYGSGSSMSSANRMFGR
jgi:hypothetical protein